MGWSGFVLAFAAFFVSHSVPVRPPLRPYLVRALGARGFTLAYSALSLGALSWLLVAAGQAPFVALWDPAPWHRHAALGLMLLAVLLVALSLGRPNPFSFGGGQDARFDPARPGLVRLTRHPMLLALAFWAGAHLLANGDLAHGLVFGTFAGFALLGRRLVDRRKRREMGAHWPALWAETRRAPLSLGLFGPSDALRFGAGGALYVVLLKLHPWVIGVDPLP